MGQVTLDLQSLVLASNFLSDETYTSEDQVNQVYMTRNFSLDVVDS